MSRGRRLLFVLLVVLVVLAVLFVPTGLPRLLAGGSGSRVEAAHYAQPGQYLVGMRTIATGEGAPLPLTIWYPASRGDRQLRSVRYPYRIKLGEPLGTVSISTYTGEALLEAQYDLSDGPYPTVLLSPGFALGASAYAWLAEHLASYGFVVIAVEHQEGFDEDLSGLWRGTISRPQDIQEVVGYLDEGSGEGSSLAGLIDRERVAVVGHSYGGYAALASAGAQIDSGSFRALCDSAYQSSDPNVFLCDQVLPHLDDMAELAGLDSVPPGLWPAWAAAGIDAIVPMAGDALFFGEEGLAAIDVPVMALGGTLDTDSPYQWGTEPTYEFASSRTKARIALIDAEHMIFTGPCERSSLVLSMLTGEFCADSHWERGRAHDLIKHFTTAFLLAVLHDDAAAAELLQPDRVEFPRVEFVSEGF